MNQLDIHRLSEHLENFAKPGASASIAGREIKPGHDSDQSDLKTINAAVMFADFGGSSQLVDGREDRDYIIWILRAYLCCASTCIHFFGGRISAFEGDGVMAIFTGACMEEAAVRSALAIQWLVENLIYPKQALLFPNTTYRMRQVVGIDKSDLQSVKTGVWDNYDIYWLGTAANNAANLTRIRNDIYSTHVTPEVFTALPAELIDQPGPQTWDKTCFPGLSFETYSTGMTLSP